MTVIVNSGAGAPAAGDKAHQIAEAFRAAGVRPQIVRPNNGSEIGAHAREALARGEETIVAAGGDGTISTVAALVAGTNAKLGVIPAGTLNHFAKDLNIPLDLPSAVEAAVHGRVVEVDVAEVSGRVFINNSSLGIYPQIVARREAEQARLGLRKWPAFLWAMVHAFRRFPFLDLRITLEGKQLHRRTAFLFVGNNEYQIAGFNLGGRRCLDAGKLGLYLTHRTGRLGLFRLALHALFGRVDQAKDFDAFCVEEATIAAHKRRLRVACDGEVMWMETPLYYRTRRKALRVLVPQEAQPAA